MDGSNFGGNFGNIGNPGIPSNPSHVNAPEETVKFNVHVNPNPSDTNPMSGEINPDKKEDTIPNPYFATEGSEVSGSLVGPNAEVFAKHRIPQPYPEITPKKYDPIGPFGTHGGHEHHKKKSDPYYGGSPFGGPAMDNSK